MKTLVIALCSSILGALVACEQRPPPETPATIEGTEGDIGRDETALEQARKLEADTYAPNRYGAAVEALEKGTPSDLLARAAINEAILVRKEAKLAADHQLRAARTLFTVVEAVLSHKPLNRHYLPSDSQLANFREDLSRAQSAYHAGDFALAGLIAQDVSSQLAGSTT